MEKIAYSADGVLSLGPYSQAIESGGLIYLSGQIPMNHTTEELIVGDISIQAEQCINNTIDFLKSINLTLDHVIKVNLYLTTIDDFALVNEVFSKKFKLK